ncbi:MAG: hypothetical protein VX498_10945, partial [Myxococcota bacterium]|nr:hypothetical protein [Myxococcota bacterium]
MPTPYWRLLILGLAASGLALPSWSFAGEVILYGPGNPNAEAAAVAEETFFALTETTEVPAGGTVNVFDLPFSARSPLWMAGDLLELPCRDPELAAIDPSAALKEGVRLVGELEYEGALLALEQGIQALPCTASSIQRQTL